MLQALANRGNRQQSSFHTIVRQFFDGSAAIRARELIDKLQTNAEKARISHELLIKGGLPEQMQETFVSVLAEHGTYRQLVSVLDSKMLTSETAIDALKARISAISGQVTTPSRSRQQQFKH